MIASRPQAKRAIGPQIAESERADADAQKIGDGKIHQFAHAADLPVAAFGEHSESRCGSICVIFAGLLAAIEHQPMAQCSVSPHRCGHQLDKIFLIQLGPGPITA